MPAGLFWQSDTFWLIEIGRKILEQRSLPAVDPYSFTSLRTHWIIYQWLTEVIFAVANNIWTLYGPAIVGMLVLSILLCVIVFRRAVAVGANPIAAWLVIVIVFHSTHPEITALRPQLFALLFMFWLQCLLEDIWAGREQRLLFVKVFLISVLWANMHVSFPMGFGMILLYAGCALLRRSLLTHYALAAGIFFSGTFITPYGIELWKFLKVLNGMYTSPEMAPLDWLHMGIYPYVYALLLLGVLSMTGRTAFPRLLLAAGLFASGCLHARFMVLFCVSSAPLIAEALTIALPKLQTKWSGVLEVAASMRIYPAVIALLAVVCLLAQPLRIGGFASPPIGAAEYLNTHPIKHNLFCTAHEGSYLIYRFHGAVKVFIDPRADLFDANFMRDAIGAASGMGWERVFARYNINEALLPLNTPLARILYENPQWQMVYKDEEFGIFVRK